MDQTMTLLIANGGILSAKSIGNLNQCIVGQQFTIQFQYNGNTNETVSTPGICIFFYLSFMNIREGKAFFKSRKKKLIKYYV